ncbi:MAG TPA: TOBE domain-containing protein [Burkholderiales bacterium]|nr:TOBE domain-containing protein [Burkholderiales bacterium]
MKISARNALAGTVSNIVKGPVSTEVTLAIARGLNIVSVISTQSARNLKLKKGMRAMAVVKATSVMIAVED